MVLVNNRTKDYVKEKMIRLLSGYPVHIITCDNGKDFAAHEDAEALNASIFLHIHTLPGKEGLMKTLMV
jgi:IS30 family transposase